MHDASQDRHRSTAQLFSGKGGNSGTCEREACVRQAAARVNNRAENSHQPTRERERRMRGFRDPKRTQEFLSCFGPIRQHFALKRHLLRASLYRKQLAARFADWREFTQLAQNPSTRF
jgi:putative transposase